MDISIFKRKIFPQSVFLKDIKGKYALARLLPSLQPHIISHEGSPENMLQTT